MHDHRIPNPADYGISSRYGFLSQDPPRTAFKDAYYQPRDDLIPQLSTLIANGDLEKELDALPLLSVNRLQDEIEYRRAYIVLAFLIHGYVWCQRPPNQHVPPQLAEPFFEVCDHLRMQPVLSYAGLCIWNWQVRNGGGMELEHLETLGSFTGSRGEAAFYHVPVLIEAEAGHLMHLLLDAIDKAGKGQSQPVTQALRDTTSTLVRMGAHLSKFYGVLKPDFFYHGIRPFLAGGNGMEEKGLPSGMVLQRSDGSQKPLKVVGGSAAQSSLVPFLDTVLGVKHEDRTVFDEMHAYMPGAHRGFLERVAQFPSLRTFVAARSNETDFTGAYNECVEQLRSWRGKHIAVVSKYIVQPARQAEKPAQVDKIETNGPSEKDKELELQGTGGSALIPFLRQAKDDTVGIQQ